MHYLINKKPRYCAGLDFEVSLIVFNQKFVLLLANRWVGLHRYRQGRF